MFVFVYVVGYKLLWIMFMKKLNKGDSIQVSVLKRKKVDMLWIILLYTVKICHSYWFSIMLVVQ